MVESDLLLSLRVVRPEFENPAILAQGLLIFPLAVIIEVSEGHAGLGKVWRESERLFRNFLYLGQFGVICLRYEPVVLHAVVRETRDGQSKPRIAVESLAIEVSRAFERDWFQGALGLLLRVFAFQEKIV